MTELRTGRNLLRTSDTSPNLFKSGCSGNILIVQHTREAPFAGRVTNNLATPVIYTYLKSPATASMTSPANDSPLVFAAAPVRIRNILSGIAPPTIVEVNVIRRNTRRYIRYQAGKFDQTGISRAGAAGRDQEYHYRDNRTSCYMNRIYQAGFILLKYPGRTMYRMNHTINSRQIFS